MYRANGERTGLLRGQPRGAVGFFGVCVCDLRRGGPPNGRWRARARRSLLICGEPTETPSPPPRRKTGRVPGPMFPRASQQPAPHSNFQISEFFSICTLYICEWISTTTLKKTPTDKMVQKKKFIIRKWGGGAGETSRQPPHTFLFIYKGLRVVVQIHNH